MISKNVPQYSAALTVGVVVDSQLWPTGELFSVSVHTEQGEVDNSVIEITQREELQVCSLRHLQQLPVQEPLHSGHARLIERLTWNRHRNTAATC